MLNLDTLRSFAEVAKSGSFSKAATTLGLSQPTISEHIRSLEARLGSALIVRGRRKSALTPAGENILTTAQRIIELSAELLTSKQAARIRLGVSSNILVYYLAPQVAWLSQSNVDVQAKSNPELARALITGAIDVAVVEWPIEAANIKTQKLFEDPLVVIVSPDHPWANLKSITVEQLKMLELFGGEPGTGTNSLLKQALGHEANNLKIAGNLGSTEAVKQAVIGNAGASIVLVGAVRRELADGRLIGLCIKGHRLSKNFYLCAREGILQSEAMSPVLKRILNSFT